MDSVCRVCGIILTINNWHNQKRQNHNYICKDCVSNYNKEYHHKNKELESTRCRKYYKEHAEKRKKEAKEWALQHPGRYNLYMKSYLKSYFKTPKGKLHKRKMEYERRGLKYKPLNERFDGAECHHVDKETVIYLPKEMHKLIWHSLKRNINMEAINAIAFFFILQQNIGE